MPPSTTGQWMGAKNFVVSNPPLVPHPPLRDDAGHEIAGGDFRGLFVLHAVLLHTGKVLCFGGHVEDAYYPPLSYVFDPAHSDALMTPIPFPAGMDLFCCHYVQLPNGRILVVGGSDKNFMAHGSVGAKNICFFEPSMAPPFGRWVNTGNEMRQGRWYPTPVLLPDGRVMVVSGRPEHMGGTISDKVEILSPPHRKSKEQIGATKQFPIYPGLHLAPNGKVYWTGTTWGQEIPNPVTAYIEIPPDPATATPWTVSAGTPPTQPRREEGMSVLLPLAGAATDGQILVIGGTTALRAGIPGTPVMQGAAPFGAEVFDHVAAPGDARTADILDTSVDPPNWSAAPTMNFGHTNGHCVLLPDESVLICGGHNRYKWLPSGTGGMQQTLEAELFTPGPGGGFARLTPTTAEPNDRMHVPRMYHSVALLLPDGRVWVAGGANPNAFEPTLTYPVGWTKPSYGPSMPLNDKTWEFFEPPYFFKPDRASQPEIDDVVRGGSTTRRIKYGSAFKIKTMQAASIDRVAIMRPGAPTHHTDTEQRYVRLQFTKGTNELNVTMESDKKKAPPGFYMLWIIDSSKRPCKLAKFIHVVA